VPLLLAPRAVRRVAQDAGLEVRSQAADIVHQRFVELAAIPDPHIGHEAICLIRQQPQRIGVLPAHLSLVQPAGDG